MDLKLPKLDQKVRFKKQPKFHFFTNVLEDSKMLNVGQEYTVRWIEVASSHTQVWLNEFLPENINGYDSHRRPYFSLNDFEWEDEEKQNIKKHD